MPDFHFPSDKPAWLLAVEDALLGAREDGWSIDEPVTFRWQGEENATWTIDPEDV